MEKMSEEPKPGVSKKRVMEEKSSSEEAEVEEIDPSFITDELLQKYASEAVRAPDDHQRRIVLFRRYGTKRV